MISNRKKDQIIIIIIIIIIIYSLNVSYRSYFYKYCVPYTCVFIYKMATSSAEIHRNSDYIFWRMDYFKLIYRVGLANLFHTL
jgi:hypothetical protein